MVKTIALLPLRLSSATLSALGVAAVWSDELDDDVEKLPPDSEDMLEASDVLVLTIAMLSSSILPMSAPSFVELEDGRAIGGVIFVVAVTVALLLRVLGATLVCLVDLFDGIGWMLILN